MTALRVRLTVEEWPEDAEAYSYAATTSTSGGVKITKSLGFGMSDNPDANVWGEIVFGEIEVARTDFDDLMGSLQAEGDEYATNSACIIMFDPSGQKPPEKAS